MNQIKKAGSWYILLNKRFLKKYIFTFLLLAVPFLVVIMRAAADEESSVLRVLIYQEEKDEITDRLLNLHGVVRYEKADDLEEACEQVRRGKADCVWEFSGDVQRSIRQFVSGEKDSAMTVYVREDTVQTRLAREQLYGILYPVISYETTRNFLKEQPYFQELEDEKMDEQLQELYEKNTIDGSIFRFAYLDNTEYTAEEKNYLTAPLRGMLAVLIFLCGLAVTMFYLQDKREGTFVWMPIRHRSLFPWIYILIGTLDAGIASFFALYLSGSFTEWTKEVLLMMMYVLAVTGFCNILRILTGTIRRLGACIPVLILVTLVMCPVFLSTRNFPLIQKLLPAFYYLNSLYSSAMREQMAIYLCVVCAGGICFEKIANSIILKIFLTGTK